MARSDIEEFQRMAANARVTSGKSREGDKYVGGSASQQERVDNWLASQSSGRGGGSGSSDVSESNVGSRGGAPVPMPASARPGSRVPSTNAIPDYLDMIYDQAFGKPNVPNTPSAAPVPSGKVAPVPRQRPAFGSTNEERQVQEALDKGISVEQIAAGAIGGGATVAIARSIIDAMRNNKGGPTVGTQPTGSGAGASTQPKSPKPSPSGDILTRNNLQQGVPTMRPDINAIFYEIFGLPMPNGFNAGGGNEPRLVPGVGHLGEPYEAYERPLPNNNKIPGPNQNVKQLGDADSPSYRENFGYNATARQAESIFNQMEMYGDYDVEKYVDPSVNPALARVVESLIRNSM